MSLKFIFGPSGSGKSYHLYNHIIEESVKHPDRNFIVLVPEQFTMQTQKDLVQLHPRKGIMNIDVLSFNRLAYRVFEETGGDQLPVLDDEGKSLILRKVAADEEDRLTVLQGRMTKPGYISEVKSVISEFTQYDISDDKVRQVIDAAGPDSRLGVKLQDILLLYRGFQDYLQEKYITKEELLDVLARQVGKSELLANSTIALDGFTGFTPVQERLLKELMLKCREVLVTVTMDPGEDPYQYTTPYQLFALGKHMTTGLIRLAREAKVPVEDPLWLKDVVPYRFRDNPPLAFLESDLFRQRQETYPAPQDAIRLAVADNPRQEAMYAASRIRALVRMEGLRYRQIGVIVSDMETYGDYLERAFAEYEIPYFMDHKRSILLNPFVEYLRSLLDMVQKNFTRDSVFRFLKTGYAGFTSDETDMLENYIVGMGIQGYKRWQQPFDRRLERMSEAELADVNRLRVRFVEKVDGLHQVLKQRQKTVKDITMALYEFMVQEDLQVQLKCQEEVFQADGEMALAKEYAQVYRIVIDLFDKFVDLLGDEPVSLEEYAKLLDAGLTEAKVGVIPPSVDQVVAGNLERTRLKDIKVLFLLGAGDANLPGDLMQSGLLTERDRQAFNDENIALSPGGKEKTYQQKYYLYLNLTKPSDGVVISYSKTTPDGKSVRASYLVQELKHLYPGLKVEDVSDLPFTSWELTPQQGIRPLIRGLKSGLSDADNPEKTGAAFKELYTWYAKQPAWRKKLQGLIDAVYYRNPVQDLTEKTAKDLYGEIFQTSITRMEAFAHCPYEHFLQYGLRLRERQEYQFASMDLGIVCHDALDRYARKLAEAGLGWIQVTEKQQKDLISTCVDEAAENYGNLILKSNSGNRYEIQRIKRLLQRNVEAMTWQLAQGDFQPAASEYRYQNGKIDRIDLFRDDGHIYAKIVDYKTGAQTFDEQEVFHGQNLQLLVYMDEVLAVEQKKYPGKEVTPAGAFYYQIKDTYVDKYAKDVEKEIRKDMRMDGLLNDRDAVLAHLEHHRNGASMVAGLSYDASGKVKASKNPKGVPEEDFRLLMDHTVKDVREDREKILKGNIKVYPYMKQGTDEKWTWCACNSCSYRSVCGFDEWVPGYQYQKYAPLSHEEIMTKLKAENGNGNELD